MATPLDVLAITNELKSTKSALEKVTNHYRASICSEFGVSVQITDWREFELIPGEVSYTVFGTEEYPLEAVKYCNDVRFFKLLTPEQAKSLTEQAASA